jgi:hypothetical protein
MTVPCVVAAQSAVGGTLPLIDGSYEISLDMDRDGRMDRAVIARDVVSPRVDLYIYLGAGDGVTDLSRPPAVLKRGLTTALVLGMESRDDGALVVSYGCGGCSDDNETTLSIAWRDGEFVVAAFAYAWDTRQGIGGCEIDFFTGAAFGWQGLDADRTPVDGTFVPEKLIDWSDDKAVEACGL